MAQERATAKTSKINRTTLVSSSLVERYCRGLDDWPRSWMGWEKDIPPGQEPAFYSRPKPFRVMSTTCGCQARRSSAISIKILLDEKLPAERLLPRVIGDDGGPLVHNGSEKEQGSFDSTCRKLPAS